MITLYFNYEIQRWAFRVGSSKVEHRADIQPSFKPSSRPIIQYMCATYACIGMDEWITYCGVQFAHCYDDTVKAVTGLIAATEPDIVTCPECRKVMELDQ